MGWGISTYADATNKQDLLDLIEPELRAEFERVHDDLDEEAKKRALKKELEKLL